MTETETIDLGRIEVTIAIDSGPRILGYARSAGPQLFATLPGEVIESANGMFAFLGGHRLWQAPEIPAITYEPDDRPVGIERTNQGVRLTGPRGVDGITKIIELHQAGDVTVVDHTLRNDGPGHVRRAAWAITQLTPGGLAVLQQPVEPSDAAGMLPNRAVVFWPYTDPTAPEIEILPGEIRVAATAATTRSKLGQRNRRGWAAYHLGKELFVKWSPPHDDALDYTDLDASIQCYRDHRFLELESLSPLTDLPPGAELRHREMWTLIDLRDQPAAQALASLPEQPAEMMD